MQISFSNKFKKQYKKSSNHIKDKLDERLLIFSENKNDLILNNHKLHGKFKNFKSIDVTGDIRAVYEEIDENSTHFVSMGSHSKLYS